MAEANPKKPIYKQLWFWVLIFIIVSGIWFFMEYKPFRGVRRDMRRGFNNMMEYEQPRNR